MKIVRVLVLGLCFLLTLPTYAGKWPTRARQKYRARRASVSRHIERRALSASRAARMARKSRPAYFRSSKKAPFQHMAPLSAPKALLSPVKDRAFMIKNDRLASSWLPVVDKDLQFLEDYRAEIAEKLKVSHAPLMSIDYASLIPSQARKIYIGEEHFQPIIHKAFEKLIFQYQKKYPQRSLIILTEFVSDRLFPWETPGRPVSQIEMPLRQNAENFPSFNKFVKEGIEVIGLEDVGYVQTHEELISPLENQAQSVMGMKERNEHWRKIIEEVSARNPQATLFIYTGNLHTHYRAPYSLAASSPQNFVLQMESAVLGKDIPFGFVMRKEPFVRAQPNQVTVLTWPESSVFSTRSGFDACLIFPPMKEAAR